jgi:hypothetical protein
MSFVYCVSLLCSMCSMLLSCVYLCYLMCIVLLRVYCSLTTSVAGLLARSQYPECPAASHLGTDFSWFPCVYKQMLRWFPRLQVATACFSCSPPDLNFVDPYLIFMLSFFHIYIHTQ